MCERPPVAGKQNPGDFIPKDRQTGTKCHEAVLMQSGSGWLHDPQKPVTY